MLESANCHEHVWMYSDEFHVNFIRSLTVYLRKHGFKNQSNISNLVLGVNAI